MRYSHSSPPPTVASEPSPSADRPSALAQGHPRTDMQRGYGARAVCRSLGGWVPQSHPVTNSLPSRGRQFPAGGRIGAGEHTHPEAGCTGRASRFRCGECCEVKGVHIPTLTGAVVSQIDLKEELMGVTPLKTDVAVYEAMDVLAEARNLVAQCEDALADGEVTIEEAHGLVATARRVLDEARESVAASEDAYNADRAIDAIRRGCNDYSHHHRGLLRNVGLQPVAANLVNLRDEMDNAPAAD